LSENSTKSKRQSKTEWDSRITALKLLAMGHNLTEIRAQVNLTDRQIRYFKSKAMNFSPMQIASLPDDVQEYLIIENLKAGKRPTLRQEVDAIKHADQLSLRVARGHIMAKHWEELAELAGDLLFIFEKYFLQPHNKDRLKVFLDQYNELDWNLGCRLLDHMKAEFPGVFEGMTDWLDILKIDRYSRGNILLNLAIVKYKKEFIGKCQICPG
jgi:hypothetical protein